jgi:hypothetical protein
MRGYSRLIKHRVHRLYLDYCEYGDLWQLETHYRDSKNQIHLRGLPECYLWSVFEELALALEGTTSRPTR